MVKRKESYRVYMHRRLVWLLTGDDSELVLQFFVYFSRFEYALKRARYVRGDRYNNAWPDWDRFASEHGDVLLEDTTDREFMEARAFLLREPPRRQIVRCGGLQWRENAQRPGESDAIYLLRLVRDVRNNLFHGGKYPNEEVSGRRLRNSALLQACLTILETCLSLDADVKHFFEENGR